MRLTSDNSDQKNGLLKEEYISSSQMISKGFERHPVDETSTGQSHLAYRLAALVLFLVMVINFIETILFSNDGFELPVLVSGFFDTMLAIGLLKRWVGARTWVLIRAVFGAILGPILMLDITTGSINVLSVICASILQWGVCGALILLLTGRSNAKRLGLAMGLFTAVILASVFPLVPNVVMRINPPHQVIEAASPAIDPKGVLIQDVGIVSREGKFLPLLEQGSATPCSNGFIYSTEMDNQDHLSLLIYRGRGEMVSRVYLVGTFRVEGISPAPRGETRVVIVLSAIEKDLTLLAYDEKTKEKLKIVEVQGPQL